MATAHVLPLYAKVSQKILQLHARPREAPSLNFVVGVDRFLLALQCPAHAWSWPRANKDERVVGFDSHQTCYKCDSRRLFDSQNWQSGAIYRRRSSTS